MPSVALSEYRDLIRLDEPFTHNATPVATSDIARITDLLLSDLTSVRERNALIETYGDPRKALHAKLISRPPLPFPSGYLEALDGLLARERALVSPLDSESLIRITEQFPRHTGFSFGVHGALWQGNITRLKVDAIVNAANETLLGCFIPFHACIDNAIHAAAGPRLRADASIIMGIQGSSEQTGQAKITRAYHLPSRFVLHTVGPVFHGDAADVPEDEALLLSKSYWACLNLASEVSTIRSVAFCSISTGLFGFPAIPAAMIALKTVDQWLSEHPGRFDLVVFDLFSERDYDIYCRTLAQHQG